MGEKDFCHNCFAEIYEAKCMKCGYVSPNESDDTLALPPGTVLNNTYKIGRVLGTGGFGITYKAQDIKTGVIVAVKEYVPMNMVYRDFGTNNLEVKMDKQKKMYDEGLISFIEEANYLVILKSSIRIVDIFNCFNENNTAYFAMEYLEGRTLDNVKEMNFDLAYSCMLKTADALKTVHNRGIVHRDISPQNVFLLNNNNIKLIDFGNARFIDKSGMNDERLILKPGFAPPELYMKKNFQGPWTDIYSLAATFYRLVTRIKLPNALERINGTPIVPIRKFLPNINYGLEVALNRALELDYDKRQKTVNEFLEEINNPNYNNTDYTEYYDASNNNKANIAQPWEKAPAAKVSPIKPQIKVPPIKPRAKAPAARTAPDPPPSPGRIPLNAYVIAYDGRRYPISDIRSIVIGRVANTSHIVINDSVISRKHCVVECSVVKKEFYITDWSSNGTFLANGTKIGYGTKYTLRAGDAFYVYLPKYTFKVVIE